MPELETVAAAFQIDGVVSSIRPLGRGHINDTYLVTTDTDNRTVLQRVNPEVFPEPWGVVENVARIIAHLSAVGGGVPALIPAVDGAPGWRDPDGDAWRMLQYFDQARTLERLETNAQARAAGYAFGDFQRRLADFPGADLHVAIPHFHDLDGYLAAFSKAAGGQLGSISDDLAFVADRRHFAERKLSTTRCVIHGDCKIDNLLFEPDEDQVVAVIDLDTVMVGDPLWDFGDLVRSAAASGAEDARTIDISLDAYRAIIEGYLEASGHEPDGAMRDALVRAPRVMALMLGVRFLTDHLSGDRYFKVDDPEHNLRRARAQFRLVTALERNGAAMTRIVTQARA